MDTSMEVLSLLPRPILKGQLALHRELGSLYPAVVELCGEVLLPACER